jgi:hypothetical protein
MCEVKLSDQSSAMGMCPGCLLKLGLDEPGGPAPPAALRPRRRRPRAAVLVAVAVIALALILFAWLRRPQPARAVRFTFDPPQNTEFTEADRLDVSPDGTRVAFTATGADGERHLWVRSLDSFAAQEVPQTAGARLPFWSPDGRFLAFFAEGKLQRGALSGEFRQTVCDAPQARGGSWSSRGVIVFAPRAAGGLFQVAATGGSPQPLTTPHRGRQEVSHRWPRFLPDGRRFLFVAVAQNRKSAVYLGE